MMQTEQQDGIALVTLTHGKANAFDLELCHGISEKFRSLATGETKAVVLTGQGRIFSAGVDLLRVLEEGPAYIREFLPAFRDFCETVFAFPRPLVVAINGHAIAGGCILAAMADRRLMAKDAGRIGLPELRVGVPFPPAAVEVMRSALPAPHFAQVMYSGGTYEPAEALARGLVDEIVETADLAAAARKEAMALAEVSPESFRLTKAQMRMPALARMRAHQAEVGAAVEQAWMSAETRERIRGYVERTFKRG
jgi:enoyl-CoA hydratase